MGIGDFIPDPVEDLIEDGVEDVGNAVEGAGKWTADRLDDAGWESGADWVRENSGSLANQMGAQVDELQLGQTEDKTKLIYGSAEKLRSTATNLRDFAGAFTKVGNGLKGLDSSRLKGKAADAFRESASIEPPKWFKAADAFAQAGGALEQFAGTVTWAQGQAQTALDKFKQGEKASDSYESKVNSYNDAVDRYNAQPSESRDPSSLPPRPGPSNPGIALMNEAQQILTEARKQRNSAADTASAAVRAARDAAPPKPSYGEQAMDGLMELPMQWAHFQFGAFKGVMGIVSFARSINPTDPYNLTHPAEYVTNLNSTVAGLVTAVNDPWGTGRQMVTDFMKDPAEGLGRLAPDVALTIATGGGGAAVKAARLADDLADAAKVRRALDDTPGGHRDPDSRRCSNGTDPVDLASGRMYLPQTDVELPGVLASAFTRRAESGYELGRFFGPSWSSTVDERLLIDASGVVHVTADGLLLTYPHPVPDLSTATETGTSRTLLELTQSGDYLLTDRDTGLIRHFPAPRGTDPGADGTAWLAETTDRNGNRVTIDRTDDGTPLSVVHSGGYHLRLTTTDGRVTALDLGDHPVMRYGYANGDLTTVTKPSGATTTFVYDDEHRITAWIDSNNRRYDYVYDERHRVIAEGGEAGHFRVRISYGEPDPDTGHRVTALTTAAGHTSRYLIDAQCHVLSATDPLGNTTAFGYDTRGRAHTRTDALGHVLAATYDGDGSLTAVDRPDGTRLHVTYNDLGLPVEVTEPDGARRSQEYDERGNLTRRTDAAGHTTTFAYDSHGRLESVTDPTGSVTTIRCDAAGLPLDTMDPCGALTRCTRDAFGRLATVTAPDGGVTRLEWTPDGDLARRIAPDGWAETWVYDGEGNLTEHTGAAGAVQRFEYGHFDQLTARTDADGARYEFDHDAELRLTRVTNPQGLTWSYEHDAAGRLTAETDFDERTIRYENDPAGRIVAHTTRLGETIRYEHDPLGRTTRKDAAGDVTTFAYDPAGRLIQASGPGGELLRQYDKRGLLKTELVDGRAITYRYDACGRRTRRVTPSGHETTYTYDAAGRPAGLTAGGRDVRFTRDAVGRELARQYGDDLSQARSWDVIGRLTAQQMSTGGREISRRTYTYRPDGYLAAVDDTLRGTQRFVLDVMGRVTAVTADRWTESYAYDRAGNQTTASWTGHRTGQDDQGERAYTGTRIVRAGTNRYEHDDAGRLTTRIKTRLSRKPDTWHYHYTTENRLAQVTTPDGTVWRYHYDPLGRRTRKQRMAADGETAAEQVDFAWDGPTLCEQTTTGGTPHPVTLTWDHQGHTPLAQTERLLETATQQEIDARFFAVVTDLIGTPTELIDESGSIAWHTRRTLWGTTTWNSNATAYTPLRYPGQYYDPETGLHYNHHRYYDPTTARYTTPDPLGLSPAPNPTTYVHNPHTWADPHGLTPAGNGGVECPPEIALGKSESEDNPFLLPDHADRTGGKMWSDWPGGIEKWESVFKSAIDPSSEVKIHFNLDDIPDPAAYAATSKAGPSVPVGSEFTAWELAMIKAAPESVRARVIWYRDGKVLPNPPEGF
ncbi:hypothetical protein SRB5_47640 [Streptomyces sp. RB5]|uniref:Type IV secretion protein Rhs n=1 Tax=Streptomyces smaragdinus TaxID=2585196 RepID=A0A7K0CM89_9ACTN|nr:RHS repeat-associated core domain-containing protein [Streptomyces smaragdinus]MQY14596.1 hypothetical protein [Streptomyces smaragdinus]